MSFVNDGGFRKRSEEEGAVLPVTTELDGDSSADGGRIDILRQQERRLVDKCTLLVRHGARLPLGARATFRAPPCMPLRRSGYLLLHPTPWRKCMQPESEHDAESAEADQPAPGDHPLEGGQTDAVDEAQEIADDDSATGAN